MNEILKLKDFDILGIIKLKDVQGIEKYVTKLNQEHNSGEELYLSRSKEYYNVKTLAELSSEREELKSLLTRNFSKRNFVILENMLNCSARSYFKNFEEYVLSSQDEDFKAQMELSRRCMEEDTRNILCILSQKGIINVDSKLKLPMSSYNSPKRAIEMDNKAILYIFCKCLNLNDISNIEQTEILTPGYGSIYIGPFLKTLYGVGYTNIFKSKYIKESSENLEQESIKKLVSDKRIFEEKKKIILLDDNIGTGDTMQELKDKLLEAGINDILSGAIQYNWRNYYKISIGEKQGINRFDISKFNFITPINYAGHKLYSHAIDLLHSSGLEYERYLKSKSYNQEMCPDIEGAILRGIISAKKADLSLCRAADSIKNIDKKELLPKYKNKTEKMNDSSIKITNTIINELKDMLLKEAIIDIKEK